VLPAASVARSESVYGPSAPPERSCERGLVHGAQPATTAPTRRHSTVAPGSAENDQAGWRTLLGDPGAETITGAPGAIVSSS
jgi:hypothetical protein